MIFFFLFSAGSVEKDQHRSALLCVKTHTGKGEAADSVL